MTAVIRTPVRQLTCLVLNYPSRVAPRCVLDRSICTTIPLSKKKICIGRTTHTPKGDTKLPSVLEPDYVKDFFKEKEDKAELYAFRASCYLPDVVIRLQSYDLVSLENYVSYLKRMLNWMKLKSTEWPLPSERYKITIPSDFRMYPDVIKLEVYQRVFRVRAIPAYKAPLLFETIQHFLPEGADMKIETYTKEHSDERFVPNPEKENLEDQLRALGGSVEDAELK